MSEGSAPRGPTPAHGVVPRAATRGGMNSGEPPPPAEDPGFVRAFALGILYAALVVAMLLLARAGAGFIYQGF